MIESVTSANLKTTMAPLELLRNNAMHFGTEAATAAGDEPRSEFEKMFFDSISTVNDLQQNASTLSQLALTNPDAVDAHDLTIAMAEANLTLSIAKQVIDRAVRAYKEILTMR